MELFFLFLLIFLMALALASGFPVAFSLPGSAIVTILLAGFTGVLFEGDSSAYFSEGGPINWLSAGVTNFRGIYWEVERDTLIAIPLFIFMGIMLQRSKIAEDLLVTMAQLFGSVRGGLGISVVFVGALLAATTGIVGATVVAMGLISLPAMLRNNYSHEIATGTIAASGTLGQIIPPSIVLIILADQLGSAVDQAEMSRMAYFKETTGQLTMPSEFGVASTSAGDMFMGALLPGLVLVLLYMAYILIIAFFKQEAAPSVPFDGKYDRSFGTKVALSLIPPLALIFIVLGSIISGIATVNQAGAIGAIGALIMAGYRLTQGEKNSFYPAALAISSVIGLLLIIDVFSINIRLINSVEDKVGLVLALITSFGLVWAILWSAWRAYKIDQTLESVMLETAKTTSLVFIILLGAAMLTAAFRGFGGEELVKDFLVGLPGGFWTQFIIVMAVIFVLGFFLDFIEIAVVVVPIVAPILLLDPGANVTAVWLGVMIGLNIQTSFLTPPFGFALFYLRGVASSVVKTVSMYKGVVPFIILQISAMFIVAYAEPLVNYLPTRLSLLGASAPPPMNPKLQSCLEDYVFKELKANKNSLENELKILRQINLSLLPEKYQKKLSKSFVSAEQSFNLLRDARLISADILEAAESYKPKRQYVRYLERGIKRIDLELKEINTNLGHLRRLEEENDEMANKVSLINELKSERQILEAKIPVSWEHDFEEFSLILKKEKIALLKYRRTTDSAYSNLTDVIKVLRDEEKLRLLDQHMDPLIGMLINTNDIKEFVKRLKYTSRQVAKVSGSYKISKLISKARKQLTRRKPNFGAAKKLLIEAIELFENEKKWRSDAKKSLFPKLLSFEEMIRNSIGLRKQPKLPREQALAIVGCKSYHRDISLYF